MQVFKKKDADADELMGLSSLKRGGKKTKKGAEKSTDKPVSPACPSYNFVICQHNEMFTGWIVNEL